MDDQDLEKISWPSFLIVTGFCFLLFNTLLRWLEGTRQPLFNWIGIVAIITGSLMAILSHYKRSEKN
ncbi:MAG: hypothetical protein ACRDEB_00260 [Chitinophagaceae bacterium]